MPQRIWPDVRQNICARTRVSQRYSQQPVNELPIARRNKLNHDALFECLDNQMSERATGMTTRETSDDAIYGVCYVGLN